MEGDGRRLADSIPELLVGAPLSNLHKAEPEQNGDDLGRFEDGNITHDSGDGDVLNSNEFGFHRWLAILQEHGNHVLKVVINLVQCFTLGVGAGEAGNETDI